MSREVKKNMKTIPHQILNISKAIEIIKMKLIEILELKRMCCLEEIFFKFIDQTQTHFM